jgi:hypothetical protein
MTKLFNPSENKLISDYNKKEIYYSQIPNQILYLVYEKKLSPEGLLLYTTLYKLNSENEGYAFPSFNGLKKILRIGTDKLKITIDELLNLNLILVEKPTGIKISYRQSSKYFLKLNPDFINFDIKKYLILKNKIKNKQNFHVTEKVVKKITKKYEIQKEIQTLLKYDLFQNLSHTVMTEQKWYLQPFPICKHNKYQEVMMGLKLKSDLNPSHMLCNQSILKSSLFFQKRRNYDSDESCTSLPPSGEKQGNGFTIQNQITPAKGLKPRESGLPLKRTLRFKSTPTEIITRMTLVPTKEEKQTETDTLPVQGLKSKIQKHDPALEECPTDLKPFMEYWIEKIKPLKYKTNVYKQSIFNLKKLIQGSLFNNCRDSNAFKHPHFETYKKRPISLKDFKLAVNNFSIMRIDEEIYPKNKKHIKSVNLDNFLLSLNANTGKPSSYFIQAHEWENPRESECKNPLVRDELGKLFIYKIKEMPMYRFTEGEWAELGKAADKLMKFIGSKPTKYIQNFQPADYADLMYRAIKLIDDIPDKNITIGTFLSEATHERRIPLYLLTDEGLGYTHQPKTQYELAAESRARQVKTPEQMADEYEKGFNVTLTPEGYEIIGTDIWDSKRQIDVGFVDENNKRIYFDAERISKNLADRAEINVANSDW